MTGETLTAIEKKIARMIQGDIDLSLQPFLDMGTRIGIGEKDTIETIDGMIRRGVIRKFGAILRHKEAGYERNFMIIWAVPAKQVEEVGNRMAAIPQITHCYERTPPFLGRFNLFTMVHLKANGEDDDFLNMLSNTSGLEDRLVLASTEEFKKISMEYFS